MLVKAQLSSTLEIEQVLDGFIQHVVTASSVKEGLKIYVRILRQQEKTLMVDMRNISRLIQNSLSKYLRILLLKRLLHFSALVQLDTDL